MKIKILAIVLGVVIGLPVVALGGSFTTSLIQGKTPSEAIQILGEQIDLTLGRVENLESQQVQTSENVNVAQLEIERLKLENENLKLKTQDNQQAIGLANKCQELEKPLTCLKNEVRSYQDALALPILSVTASLQEVAVAQGVPWYAKPATDEICFKGYGANGPVETCNSRARQISNINQDRKDAKERAARIIESRQGNLQKLESEFNALSCKAVLDKYIPNRMEPGCG